MYIGNILFLNINCTFSIALKLIINSSRYCNIAHYQDEAIDVIFVFFNH